MGRASGGSGPRLSWRRRTRGHHWLASVICGPVLSPPRPTSGNRLGASQRRGLWRPRAERGRTRWVAGAVPVEVRVPDHPRRCPSKAGMPLRQGAQASSVWGSGFRQLSSFPSRLVGGTTALAVCSVPQALPRCLQSWEKERLLLVNEPAEAGDAVRPAADGQARIHFQIL